MPYKKIDTHSKLIYLLTYYFFSPLISQVASYMDVDTSILDVSAELISEAPVKSKPTPLSPRSVSQDVIKCLGIVTIKKVESMPPH